MRRIRVAHVPNYLTGRTDLLASMAVIGLFASNGALLFGLNSDSIIYNRSPRAHAIMIGLERQFADGR